MRCSLSFGIGISSRSHAFFLLMANDSPCPSWYLAANWSRESIVNESRLLSSTEGSKFTARVSHACCCVWWSCGLNNLLIMTITVFCLISLCVSLLEGAACFSRCHSSDICSAVSQIRLASRVTCDPCVSVGGGRNGAILVRVVPQGDCIDCFRKGVPVGPLLTIVMRSAGYFFKVSSPVNCFLGVSLNPKGLGGGGGGGFLHGCSRHHRFQFIQLPLDPDCDLVDACDLCEQMDGEWSLRFLEDDLDSSSSHCISRKACAPSPLLEKDVVGAITTEGI